MRATPGRRPVSQFFLSACFKTQILRAKTRSHCRAPLRLTLPPSHCNAATRSTARTVTLHRVYNTPHAAVLRLHRAQVGRGGPVPPKTRLRLGLFGAHSFKRPQVNPGSLYRRGRSTFKSRLWATTGGKRPHIRPKTPAGIDFIYLDGVNSDCGYCHLASAAMMARPAQNPFASCPVQRALLTPQVNPGSLYRCSKITLEQPVGHSKRKRGLKSAQTIFTGRLA